MAHGRPRGSVAPALTVLTTLALFVCAAAPASSESGLAEALAAPVEAAYRAGAYPGVVAAVYRGEEPLLRRAWGFADLEHRVAMTPESVMYVGSITKSFTGLAIHQLRAAGRLTLESTVGELLPEFDGPAARVTVAQLLTHTGGIPDYVTPDVEKDFTPYTRDQVLSLFASQPLEFEPGTEWRYTNSGTYLLGLIIERLSGRSYGEYVAERIAQPLGLASTELADEQRIIPGRAHGYVNSATGFQNAGRYDPLLPFSAGALLSTADDLHKFMRAAYGAGAVSAFPETLRDGLLEPVSVGDGVQPFYRLGSVAVVDLDGCERVTHAGLTSGFTSFFTYCPAADLSIVLLVNGAGVAPHPAHLEATLARLALGVPPPEIVDAPLAAEQAATYEGYFEIAPVHFYGADGFSFVVRDGRLHLQFGAPDADAPALPLLYQGADTFVSALDSEQVLRFTRRAGSVTGLEIAFYGQPFHGVRREAP